MTRILITRKGPLHFPAFVPVTTFGEKYPLDDLIRPYLQRLSPAVMVSAYFLRDARDAPDLSVPLFVDSGGFASVFMNATVTRTRAGLGVIDFQGRRISPLEVLELQERVADVAFTLDLLIPPSLPPGTPDATTPSRARMPCGPSTTAAARTCPCTAWCRAGTPRQPRNSHRSTAKPGSKGSPSGA